MKRETIITISAYTALFLFIFINIIIIGTSYDEISFLREGRAKTITPPDTTIEYGSIYVKNPHVYDNEAKGMVFDDGMVKDTAMAIVIAKTIWKPMSDEEYIPYNIGLAGDSVWIVNGKHLDAWFGAIYTEIRKSDGKILRIILEK